MTKKTEPQLTIADLLQAEQGLGTLNNAPIPNHRAAYRIGKASRQVAQELKPFYEQRAEIAQSLDLVDDQGRLDMTSACFPEFSKTVDDLAQEPVDLIIHKVPLSWLDGVDLSGATLMFLDWLIDDDDPDA